MQNATETTARSSTRYELPPEGATLLGYIVRRMHKTALLAPVAGLLNAGQSAEALAQIALYAAAASASFGPAYYQPRFDRAGDTAGEPDPATGAMVSARLEASSPHYRVSNAVEMPDGSRFAGVEEVTGTTVGLRGLGMPAPSRFEFTAPDGGYTARLTGIITSELAPAFLGPWRIRAYGSLELHDSSGNTGRLTLAREGRAEAHVTAVGGGTVVRQMDLAGRR
jgi:hypothetical protein